MRKYLGGFRRSVTKRELVLIFLLVISFIFFSVSFAIVPRIIKLNSLENQLSELNKEKSSYEKLYRKYLNYDEILGKYTDLLKSVPGNNDLSKFIRELEVWGEQLGITIISILPQDIITENFSEIEVNIVPCEITIGGEFDSLISFLDKLESCSRISQVNELRLTKIEDISNSNFPWTLTVKVNLYYFPQTT
mgnify:FL=1